MKNLTLNETWKECLRMWKWIVEQRQKELDALDPVFLLKRRWLNNNDYYGITNDCFFCKYAHKKDGYGDITIPEGSREIKCSKCPGRLVAKRFSCQNMAYDWYFKPEKFYQKLLQVNQQRKQKRRKTTV